MGLNFQDVIRDVHDPANHRLNTSASLSGGQATITPLQAWPDPKTYIGLVTVDIGTSNTVVLGAGTNIIGTATVRGNIILSTGINNIGFASVTPIASWPDPKNYIGLVTATISGNVTISDSKGFIGLVSVTGPVKLTDGTNTMNVLPATSVSNSLSNQGAALIAPADMEVTYVTNSAQAVASTDVTNYRWVSVHHILNGTNSTVNFQGSNDNTNWVGVSLQTSAAIGISPPQTSLAAAGVIFSGSLNYRYFRLNVTGISAATTSGTIEFSTMPGFTMTAFGTFLADNADGVVATSTIGKLAVLSRNSVYNSGTGNWERMYGTTAGTYVQPVGNVTISDSKGYIGLVTTTPAYGSNSTVYTGVISGTGNTTVLVAPASNRFFIKNMFVSSLGRSELEVRSGATTIIPFTSLSTTAGYVAHFGEQGLPGRAQADALVVNLNGGATIGYMFNVRFEA